MHGSMPSATTILLVAPSEPRRTALAQRLEALGYRVVLESEVPPDAPTRPQYDLLIVDLGDEASDQARAIAQRSACTLADDTPVLMLTDDRQIKAEAWVEDALNRRIVAALRSRSTVDVLGERIAQWEGLNVLDPESLLFSRRYFEAILPLEIERAKRMHQPMTLLALQFEVRQVRSTDDWRSISAQLLTGLRQTDLLTRYGPTTILALFSITEIALARTVAARLLKTIELINRDDGLGLGIALGLAAYPQHGSTPSALLAAALQPLNDAPRQAPTPGVD